MAETIMRDFPTGSPHACVYSHDLNGLQDLLKTKDADFILSTHNGEKSALHVAAIMGYAHMAQVLLDYSSQFLEMRNAQGFTALHSAASEGRADVVKVLLDRGADIDATCTALGTTPLHRAALSGEVDCVDMLCSRGAKVKACDRSGEQPIHGAAYYGHTQTLVVLANFGADVNAPVKDKRRFTPLLLSIRRNRPDTARALLKLGAGVNVPSAFQETPLHIASQNGIMSVIRLLVVEYHCDVSYPDDSGNTAVEVADARGYPEISGAIEAALSERASPTPEEENKQVQQRRRSSFKRLLPSGSISRIVGSTRRSFASCFGTSAEVEIPTTEVAPALEANPADS